MLMQWISSWRTPTEQGFASREALENVESDTYSCKLPEYQRVQTSVRAQDDSTTPLLWVDQPLFDDQQVIIESQGLTGSTQGMRDVWVSLRNQGKSAVPLAARAMFYDANKHPINSKAPWKKITVPAKSSSLYFKSSQSGLVEYVLVEIKRLDLD